MDKSFQQFSPEQLRQLLSSPTAQDLMAMLNREHTGSVQSALADAQRGDMTAAKAALQACLSDPRTRQLIKKLQEEQHG
jgi:hypothetical protein